MEQLVFFTISSVISLDASKSNPSWIYKLKDFLFKVYALHALLLSFDQELNTESSSLFSPLKIKATGLWGYNPVFPNLQILNWNYIKCELCFSLLAIICVWVTTPTNAHQTHQLPYWLLPFFQEELRKLTVSHYRSIPNFTLIMTFETRLFIFLPLRWFILCPCVNVKLIVVLQAFIEWYIHISAYWKNGQVGSGWGLLEKRQKPFFLLSSIRQQVERLLKWS